MIHRLLLREKAKLNLAFENESTTLRVVKVILIAFAMLVTVASVSAQGVLLFSAAGSLSPAPNTGAAIVPGTVNFITDIDYAPVTPPTSDAGGVEMTANTLVLTDFNVASPVMGTSLEFLTGRSFPLAAHSTKPNLIIWPLPTPGRLLD